MDRGGALDQAEVAGELWWLLRRWHAEVDDGPVQISPRKHEAALLSAVAVPVEPRNNAFYPLAAEADPPLPWSTR